MKPSSSSLASLLVMLFIERWSQSAQVRLSTRSVCCHVRCLGLAYSLMNRSTTCSVRLLRCGMFVLTWLARVDPLLGEGAIVGRSGPRLGDPNVLLFGIGIENFIIEATDLSRDPFAVQFECGAKCFGAVADEQRQPALRLIPTASVPSSGTSGS